MRKLTTGFVTAAAVVLALVLLRAYWRHQGAADAKLNATDAAHVAHVDSLERWAKDRRRVEDSLRVRVAHAESLRVRAGRTVTRLRVRVDTLRATADTAALVVMQDSVIAALTRSDSVNAARAEFYRLLWVSADSARTVFHAALHDAEALREAWKRKAQRRFACVAGAGATAAWSGQVQAGLSVACGLRL